MPKAEVFTDGISPEDIIQGGLGDCYLLSALCALAERPSIIERLFLSRKSNNEGIYGMWICDTGDWELITVDDYFLCGDSGPVYSKCNGDEFWVLLLEKVYAKIYGSYHAIESGFPEEAFRDLTGAPAIRFMTDNAKDTFSFLTAMFKKNFVVTGCIENKNQGRNIANKYGIISSHAYTILSSVKTSTGVCLVKLRNPWGKLDRGEWTGKWHRTDEIWTE